METTEDTHPLEKAAERRMGNARRGRKREYNTIDSIELYVR